MFYYWTAVALDHVGMTYGTLMKPTDFACLVLKMLQISPGKDIVKEFIRQEDFKVRAYICIALALSPSLSLRVCEDQICTRISVQTKEEPAEIRSLIESRQ